MMPRGNPLSNEDKKHRSQNTNIIQIISPPSITSCAPILTVHSYRNPLSAATTIQNPKKGKQILQLLSLSVLPRQKNGSYATLSGHVPVQNPTIGGQKPIEQAAEPLILWQLPLLQADQQSCWEISIRRLLR